MLEIKDILASAVETALQARNNRNTLIPALKTLSLISAKQNLKAQELR